MSTTLNKNLCSSNIPQPMIFAARPNEEAKPMIIDVEANNALMKNITENDEFHLCYESESCFFKALEYYIGIVDDQGKLCILIEEGVEQYTNNLVERALDFIKQIDWSFYCVNYEIICGFVYVLRNITILRYYVNGTSLNSVFMNQFSKLNGICFFRLNHPDDKLVVEKEWNNLSQIILKAVPKEIKVYQTGCRKGHKYCCKYYSTRQSVVVYFLVSSVPDIKGKRFLIGSIKNYFEYDLCNKFYLKVKQMLNDLTDEKSSYYFPGWCVIALSGKWYTNSQLKAIYWEGVVSEFMFATDSYEGFSSSSSILI